MTQDELNQTINDALDTRQTFNGFNPSLIPYHTHNGTDSPQINASDLVGASSAGRIYLTGAQTINTGSSTTVHLNTESFSGITTDLANYEFIIDTTGRYFITAQIAFDTPVINIGYVLTILQNGSQVGYTRTHASVASLLTIFASVLIDLNKGDLITIQAFQASASNLALDTSNAALNYLQIISV